jgi:hypothetical protein
MTRFQQFNRELKRRGWRYDVGGEGFFDEHGRRINWHRLVRLLPDMTLDELASYQDDRWDRSPDRRRFARALSK